MPRRRACPHAPGRRRAPAPRSHSMRSAFRRERAYRPPAHAMSRGHAVRWAEDCRWLRSLGPPAVPHKSRKLSRCRARRQRVCACSISREAIASTRETAPNCIAGITFSTAIRATPSTPQETLLVRAVSKPPSSERRRRPRSATQTSDASLIGSKRYLEFKRAQRFYFDANPIARIEPSGLDDAS